MAKCSRCKKEMCNPNTKTCETYKVVNFPDGIKMAPIPYTTPDPNIRCHDCGIAAGGVHHLGCDMEICPRCGGQFLGCSCLVSKIKKKAMKYDIESAVEEIMNLGIELLEMDVVRVCAAIFFTPKGKYCIDRLDFRNKSKEIKFIKEVAEEYEASIVVVMDNAFIDFTQVLSQSANQRIFLLVYGEDKTTNYGIAQEWTLGKNMRIKLGKKTVFPKGHAIGPVTGILKNSN